MDQQPGRDVMNEFLEAVRQLVDAHHQIAQAVASLERQFLEREQRRLKENEEWDKKWKDKIDAQLDWKPDPAFPWPFHVVWVLIAIFLLLASTYMFVQIFGQ